MTDAFAHIVPRPSLHILTPSHSGTVQYDQSVSTKMLIRDCNRNRIPIRETPLSGCSLIHMARNRLVREFLLGDSTHALFLDDDVIIDPNDIFQMLVSGFDVVGLPIAKKTLNVARIAERCVHLEKKYGMKYFDDKTKWREILAAGAEYNCALTKVDNNVKIVEGYSEVEHIGTGCLLIARTAFDHIAKVGGKALLAEATDAWGKPIDDLVMFFEFVREGTKPYGDDLERRGPQGRARRLARRGAVRRALRRARWCAAYRGLEHEPGQGDVYDAVRARRDCGWDHEAGE